jgi:glycogen synthase
MRQDFSWATSARQYEELYEIAISHSLAATA